MQHALKQAAQLQLMPIWCYDTCVCCVSIPSLRLLSIPAHAGIQALRACA